MQDRHRQLDEILLRRAAGPYIWVINGRPTLQHSWSASVRTADLDELNYFPLSFSVRFDVALCCSEAGMTRK
jgi:hypothetical protein